MQPLEVGGEADCPGEVATTTVLMRVWAGLLWRYRLIRDIEAPCEIGGLLSPGGGLIVGAEGE